MSQRTPLLPPLGISRSLSISRLCVCARAQCVLSVLKGDNCAVPASGRRRTSKPSSRKRSPPTTSLRSAHPSAPAHLPVTACRTCVPAHLWLRAFGLLLIGRFDMELPTGQSKAGGITAGGGEKDGLLGPAC